MTSLPFYVQAGSGQQLGPISDDDLRDALRDGRYDASTRVRSVGAPLWLPAQAWAALALPPPALTPPPAGTDGEGRGASPDLMLAPADVLDMVRFVVSENGQPYGPLPGKVVRDGFEGGRYRSALIAPLGTSDWLAARKLFDRTLSDSARATQATSAPDIKKVRCPTCRELVVESVDVCPECDEPMMPASVAPSTRGSIADDQEGASWFRMHWRPLVTFGAIAGLIMSGITLRYLAPDRFSKVEQATATAMGAPPPSACETACWSGEACQAQTCVWQKPNGVGHVAPRPGVAGPFALPNDVTDAVMLDDERFAIGLLTGTEIRSTRTGQSLGLVAEAAQTRQLIRLNGFVYAVGPQHIAVLETQSMRLKKTLEMGAIIGDVTVGANGRRALVSLPGAHAIAVLSTEIHVELDRIRFGDDNIGPVGVDDSGERAITMTGAIPVPGLPEPQGGALYAFDPTRLASEQDRVRAAMLGNPVSVAMSPDGETSWVALRQANKLVPLSFQASGALRVSTPIDACDQPEQVEIVRKDRRAVLRCNRGRALEVFDLETQKLLRHIPFNAPAADMVVSPDGEQVVVALPSQGGGSLAFVDLTTFEVEMVPLTEPPSRVRMSASGDAVIALSDRSKVLWVVR